MNILKLTHYINSSKSPYSSHVAILIMAGCIYKLLFLPHPPQLTIPMRCSSKVCLSLLTSTISSFVLGVTISQLSGGNRLTSHLSPSSLSVSSPHLSPHCCLSYLSRKSDVLMISCYIPFLDISHPQSSRHLSAFSVHPEHLVHTPMISLITLFGYCLFTCLFFQWPMRP